MESLRQSARKERQERHGDVAIGSEEHRRLFCELLLETFDPYRPAVIGWPVLAPEAQARLVGLPFWDVAIEIEENAGARMQALADVTSDPIIREALALNAFEERRHKEVLRHMMRFYGIVLGGERRAQRPRHPRWAFLRTGYGECFDSFFAFGLFALARQSGFFPRDLVEVFEPVIQEEARHNLFFVNWVGYTRARLGLPSPTGFRRTMCRRARRADRQACQHGTISRWRQFHPDRRHGSRHRCRYGLLPCAVRRRKRSPPGAL